VKLDIVDTHNKKVGDVEVADSVFGGRVKPWLFYEVVKAQMANRRAGTHSTKTIDEVRGTGKKPFRQKGTGRARQGSNRAPHMRGGTVVHGPRPRSHGWIVPKKMVQGALRSALALRQSEAKLHVVQGWAPAAPKTKEAIAVLSRFEAGKALVVGSKSEINLMKSIRNLPSSKFLPVEALNVYDILHHDHLFISESVIAGISERLAVQTSRRDVLAHENAAKRGQ